MFIFNVFYKLVQLDQSLSKVWKRKKLWNRGVKIPNQKVYYRYNSNGGIIRRGILIFRWSGYIPEVMPKHIHFIWYASLSSDGRLKALDRFCDHDKSVSSCDRDK